MLDTDFNGKSMYRGACGEGFVPCQYVGGRLPEKAASYTVMP